MQIRIMALNPKQWYKFKRYGHNHLVHEDEPDIAWCGRPMIEDEAEPATNSKKHCPFCKQRSKEYMEEKQTMRIIIDRAGRAGW